MKTLDIRNSLSGTISKVGNRMSKKTLALAVAVIAVLFAAAAFKVDSDAQAAAKLGAPISFEKHQDSLRAQVDTVAGEPRAGRDPAATYQTSLDEAAAAPNGAGMRTDKPAAGVTGSMNHPVQSPDVYGDPKKTGINSAGCFIDYGIAGEQCMPAGMRSADGSLNCAGVRMHFADGIRVTGTDRFKLDTNLDGIACGVGE